MKKLLTAVATAIASFATSIAAQAADLPMEPVYKAPVVVAAVYNWTGFISAPTQDMDGVIRIRSAS